MVYKLDSSQAPDVAVCKSACPASSLLKPKMSLEKLVAPAFVISYCLFSIP